MPRSVYLRLLSSYRMHIVDTIQKRYTDLLYALIRTSETLK